MKYGFKSNVFTILLLMTVLPVNSQTNDECRYLTVLTYIRTNAEINKKIKAFFPWDFKKKDKYVEFNVSDRIDFLGISYFDEKLKAEPTRYGISEELITIDTAYRKKYFFESFRSEFLRKLIERNDSRLSLTFSKPIDNYLVVELGDFIPELSRNVKFGKGMQMFFLFDEWGAISKVLYSGSAYN